MKLEYEDAPKAVSWVSTYGLNCPASTSVSLHVSQPPCQSASITSAPLLHNSV